MKRTLGRVGATISAVALLAGGLVGVATPAVADDRGSFACNGSKSDTKAEAIAAAQQKCPNWTGYHDGEASSGKGYIGYGYLKEGQSLESSLCDPGTQAPVNGLCENIDPNVQCVDGQVGVGGECVKVDAWWVAGEPVQEPVQVAPPPPPCWDSAINNCPVGGALRFAAPKYAMVGVPVTMYAYASWRPDANSPAQPTNGTAVIRVDGEDYSGVEFVDGVAEWRFIPETEGMKEFTASGVLFSGLSGANAYIDTVPARTYVLEYDPAAYATALKNKRVEVGDTYVITDPNQARSYLEERYEWSVSEKSDDVCAVYETKKGAVKAKFNGEGKCTVIWLDKESEDSGKYTFIAKK